MYIYTGSAASDKRGGDTWYIRALSDIFDRFPVRNTCTYLQYCNIVHTCSRLCAASLPVLYISYQTVTYDTYTICTETVS